jgi:hypothetical protein
VRVGPPKRRRKAKPVALLSPGWKTLGIETAAGTDTVRGANACFDALIRLESHTLYTVSSPGRMRMSTGARCWTAHAWRGRITSIRLDGTRAVVRSLRGTLEGSEDPFGDLEQALGFFGAYGVAPSSLSAMSWALWRSTLPREIEIGASPQVGRSALYGGRQSIREPRTYSHMASADMVAAYPFSMAREPYALSLREVSSSTALDPDAPGIVMGCISVPIDLPFGPVPLRIASDMITFPSGQVNGSWTWREADHAEQLGCRVQVDRCFAPLAEADLFSAWWKVAADGRALPGRAAAVTKAAANSLWGLFGMRGDDTEEIRWSDDAGLDAIRVALAARTLPHAWTAHIAAETASRVRVRMLEEIDARAERGSPVHVDTDGMIIRRSALVGMPTRAEPGQFRVKQTMRKVDVRAPQVYRYLCTKGCGETHPGWHYSVAGVPEAAAKHVFDRVGRQGCSVSFTGTDLVLPAHNAQDSAARARAKLEALSVMGMLG